MKRSAGIIYGPEAHHIDHLAVLCQILKIPLFVTEEEIAAIVSRYYPNLELILSDYLSIGNLLVSQYDVVFYSMPRDLFDEVFFFVQKLNQKKIHTVWCPHGNSDKGNNTFYMEALKKEEAALVYGPQMLDFLKRKAVFENLKGHVVTGNFRYQFYLENQEFYDQIFTEEVSRRLTLAEKTILYAPTWQDYEKSTSFFTAISSVIEKLPENWNLIVKLHPNLLLQEEDQVQYILEQYENLPHVLFLKDFPPIYPLLDHVDIYIGDMSSIGYDFLTFDRPLFFLNQNQRDSKADQGLYLYRTGTEIRPEQYEDIYRVIQEFLLFEVRDLSKIRQEVYTYAFGPKKDLNTLRQEIEQMLTVFPETDLNFF